ELGQLAPHDHSLLCRQAMPRAACEGPRACIGMISEATQEIAPALLQGTPPDAQPWEISAAVQSIVDSLAQPNITAQSVCLAADTLNKCRRFEKTRMLAEA